MTGRHRPGPWVVVRDRLLILAALVAGLAVGGALTTDTLASAPAVAPASGCQAAWLTGWTGIMAGPDPEHLTYYPRSGLPASGSPWWRGRDTWLTCR